MGFKSTSTIFYSRSCIYYDEIGVCNKKPRDGLYRQECKVPCSIGKFKRPQPPPPPPPRKINY
jgi:hypothetical protein